MKVCVCVDCVVFVLRWKSQVLCYKTQGSVLQYSVYTVKSQAAVTAGRSIQVFAGDPMIVLTLMGKSGVTVFPSQHSCC